MMAAYAEIRSDMAAEGKDVPKLEFVYKYDLQSFFDYFPFLNVSKMAELAGINPSLMRLYTSGVVNAGKSSMTRYVMQSG